MATIQGGYGVKPRVNNITSSTIVMELQLLALQFNRSLCEGNFNLHVHSLNHLAPWFFALDHLAVHSGLQYTYET